MKTAVHLILTLSVIGIIAGGSLSVVSQWAAPLIAANQKAATEQAIFMVHLEGKRYEAVENAGCEVYKVFDGSDKLLGYSLVYEGNGFQGKIRIMAALSEDLNKILAYEVLEQSETPGLGTKVTEEPFKGQFKNLVTTPSINWVKGVPPSKPNEITAITGATISSKSIVAILNNGIEHMRSIKEKGGIL